MEKRARTLVVVQEGDLSFFCPYEPGAKEKMKADRNTDNRPTLSAFRAVFIFSFACGDSRKAKGPEAPTPARRVTGLHKKSWTPHPPGFHIPWNSFYSLKECYLFPGISLIPSTTILILLPTSARAGIIRINLSRAPLHRSLRA